MPHYLLLISEQLILYAVGSILKAVLENSDLFSYSIVAASYWAQLSKGHQNRLSCL